MKVLLDTCVWGGVLVDLQAAGFDVIWAGNWVEDPGDEEILERAFREQRVLVTLDKDFGELAIVRRLPHAGMVRLANLGVREQGVYCLQALNKYAEELAAGAILTVERRRVRVRSGKKPEA